MLVYKYRGGDSNIFSRDLEAIENNEFYSASIQDLNDPCEGITDTRRIQEPLRFIGRKIGMGKKEDFDMLDSNTNEVLSIDRSRGIYSLSKNHLDELLWAHYANSHKGFCLAYDLDKLLLNIGCKYYYSDNVKYKKSPPKVGFFDMFNAKEKRMIAKYGFCKSKRWEYEQEFRIITKNIGLHSYSSNALKGIYFGYKMEDRQKEIVIAKLKNRELDYYQIKLEKSSYKLISQKYYQ